jgi:hypothetical protein
VMKKVSATYGDPRRDSTPLPREECGTLPAFRLGGVGSHLVEGQGFAATKDKQRFVDGHLFREMRDALSIIIPKS